MAHVPKNPAIPMRDGVSPSCLALPRLRHVPWPTLLDCLAERLPAIARTEWLERMAAGEVVDDTGRPLDPSTPYLSGTRIYYWRRLVHEPVIPFEETIVHHDDHLVVADKPHFLPVTPGGRYVQQTLLVRLKRKLGLPNLSPLHRIDRETAGLVIFSVRPHDRDAYQRLFRDRRIDKVYEAIAPWNGEAVGPWVRQTHLREDREAFYRMQEAASDEALPPNSETRIERLECRGRWARYRLQPVTGKRHQLRVHMHAMGWPIAGDQFYPVTRRGPGEWDDFHEPLRLLAQTLAFDDPVTGQRRCFTSQRSLDWPSDDTVEDAA